MKFVLFLSLKSLRRWGMIGMNKREGAA